MLYNGVLSTTKKNDKVFEMQNLDSIVFIVFLVFQK